MATQDSIKIGKLQRIKSLRVVRTPWLWACLLVFASSTIIFVLDGGSITNILASHMGQFSGYSTPKTSFKHCGELCMIKKMIMLTKQKVDLKADELIHRMVSGSINDKLILTHLSLFTESTAYILVLGV